jgi:hypothetical protein
MLELFGTPLYDPRLLSRSISAENPRGDPGGGGKSARGRKGAPCLSNLRAGQSFTFAEIEGPGAIRHIWLTVARRHPQMLRNLILRCYWNGQSQPSIEAPLGDFFGISHGATSHFESAYLTNVDGRSFNSYFLMPFASAARLNLANESGEDLGMFFYTVDYTLGDDVTQETPCFHAQFRRVRNTTLFSFYRFHGHDPVYFSRDLRVTLQQMGNDGSVEPLRLGDRPPMDHFIKTGQYKKDAPGGNFERSDDVSSTAYWYQTLPTQPFPPFPDKVLRSLDLVPDQEKGENGAAAGPPA